MTVLGNAATRGHGLDYAKPLEAKKMAEALMVNKDSEIDFPKAQAELATAIAQLGAIARLRRTK